MWHSTRILFSNQIVQKIERDFHPPRSSPPSSNFPPLEAPLSEERYRSVVDNSPYGIYRVSYDGRFITVNPALCAMVGYTADELFASGISVLYETRAQRERLLADYLERPHGKPVEVPWVRKDGSTILTRVWVYADRNSEGRITYFDGY